MPFEVAVTYRTLLGQLKAEMTTKQTVETREEAHELRDAVRRLPGMRDAVILIKNAVPMATVDEALVAITRALGRFEPV